MTTITSSRFVSMPLRVIGLTGLAGSGKDTVAGMLATQRNFVPIAFADKLRTEIMTAFGVPLELLTDRASKEVPTKLLALKQCIDMDFEARMIEINKTCLLDMTAPRSPRQIMQWWGTEYRRAQDPHYWAAHLAHRLQDLLHKGRSVAVTDVRFMNEALVVRNVGGNVWQVQRPGLSKPKGTHESETAGEEFFPDATVHNNGSLHQLLQSTLRALGQAGAMDPHLGATA